LSENTIKRTIKDFSGNML